MRSSSPPRTDDLLFLQSNFCTENGLVTDELFGLIASPKLYLRYPENTGAGLTISLSCSFLLSRTVMDRLTPGI